MRILVKKWFLYDSTENYAPPAPEPKSYHWRMFFSLINKINLKAKEMGAKLAIFMDGKVWELMNYHFIYKSTGK